MQRGINLLANAIKPTLGPLPRQVAIERIQRGQSPELLDKGALIARRVISILDPDAEMGAMLLRQMLWQQYESYGDGTATAALLFQSVFNDGVKYITAGGNAMRLRMYLHKAMQRVLSCLAQQKTNIAGREQIRQMALMLSQDGDVAEILSEVFDTLGEYGRIDIRSGHGRTLEREYIHGIHWESGVHSQELIVDKIANKISLEHCALFLSDLVFDDPRTLLPIIATAAQYRALVIIASKLSDRAMSLLTHINKTQERFQVIAVKIPTQQLARIHMLEDVGRITGARLFWQAAQVDVQRLQASDLGIAKQIWANKDYFCIVEDADDGQRRVAYLTELHQRLQNKALTDEQRIGLRGRIGQLQGASATLLVGGGGHSDIDARKAKLKEIVSTLRGSLDQGIIPGGGVAMLNCQSALRAQMDSDDPDERAAYRILAHSLEMPVRQLLENAGFEAGRVLARLQNEPSGHGFNVAKGNIRPMLDVGIVDSAGVVAAALERAVSSAALALTVDVLVHHRNPGHTTGP